MSVTELRRFTIGGSDAAAACGIDPHRSRVMLWAEKTGRVERVETEAMAWGKRLEPLVFAEVATLYPSAIPAPAEVWKDAERKWLTGHPDGFVELAGERGLLEIKTTNAWAHRTNEGAVPVQYDAQIQHYLYLTGLRHALLAVLVGGQRLELREIERDDDAIGLLLTLEEDFYRHLRRDKPPAPDGSASARAALVALFPEAEPSKLVRLDREHWEAVRELRARKEQADVIAGQVTKLENRLKLYMGDAELAISPHDTDAIRWATVQSRRVDTTALREHRPEVAEKYTTVTTTRRFKLL